jgi:hypothetical protein
MHQLLKRALNAKFIVSALLLSLCGQHLVADLAASSPVPKLYNGNGGVGFTGSVLVTAWQGVDDNNNTIVKAAVGNPFDSPSNWTVTTLSAGISPQSNSNPLLSSNSLGDVVVSWQFYNFESGNIDVAAATLQNNTTTWDIQVVSDDSAESAGYFDQLASIDNNGDILLTYTSTNLESSTIQVRAATTNISNPTWSPVTVAP